MAGPTAPRPLGSFFFFPCFFLHGLVPAAMYRVPDSGAWPTVSALCPRADVVHGGRRAPLGCLKHAVSVRRQVHLGTTACCLGLILAAAMFLNITLASG